VFDANSLLMAALFLIVLAAVLIVLLLRRHRNELLLQADLREREQRLRLALWATGEYYWELDLTTRKVSWLPGKLWPPDTPSGQALAPYSDETTVSVFDLIHPEDLARTRAILEAYLAGRTKTFKAEFRARRTVAGWRWVRVRGRTVAQDGTGPIMRVAGTALDVSSTYSAENERKIASLVLHSMTEAVAVVDQKFNFVSINPAFLLMTGFASEEIIGYNMRLLHSREHDFSQYHKINLGIHQTGHWSGELWQRRKNGEEFLCTVEFNTVRSNEHFPQLHVAVFNDITRQKDTEQQVHYLTNFDPLTNLPNRALLAERLPLSILNARHRNTKVAVLFLDLDRFRDINEQFGPAAGDNILRVVAQRLQQAVGVRRMLTRLGGDEFAVIVEDFTAPESADEVARQVLAAFDTPLTLDDQLDVTVSFSIGISLYPDHALISNELIKQADTAMYQAKASGRRAFMRYDGKMDLQTQQRVALSGTLRKVLDRSELSLAYQPRLELASSRISSVEVLLRWFNREHGNIAPAAFIPLAEESGMIMDIGKWVLNEACLTLQEWRRQGMSDVMISVNISLMQLLRDDFMDLVQGILTRTGTPPGSLELELTESMLMVDIEHAASKLQAFRALGISVAVDDFGTGYSSLAYLRRLPVTTIKIDKSFIKDLASGHVQDAAIASSIIHMGHSLGLKVVAEGVETEAQREFLLSRGCDEIQGFWLAKPMPAEQARMFIRNWSHTSGGFPALPLDETQVTSEHGQDSDSDLTRACPASIVSKWEIP